MIETAVKVLCDPAAPSAPLRLEAFEQDRDHVIEGALHGVDGAWYPVIDGLPCFLTGSLRPDLGAFCARHGLVVPTDAAESRAAADQAKTTATFSDKWRRFTSYGLAPEHEAFLFGWYAKKFGLASREDLPGFYAGCDRVLEVGPGSGFNTRFIANHCRGEVFALDISEAARTTFENTRDLPNCTVIQADLMAAPFADASFDLIVADGVLHHTPDTREAVRALYRKLRPGGRFFFYVYRQMGAVRRFCDAHVRESFTRLEPEACYAACEPLTELGRELSRLGATITLTKPIDILGIPAGTHDVQRLLYYNFLKCFWNEAFDYETNNMVNFDWYHPHDAWQHTEEEVTGWLAELGARDVRFNDANPNGTIGHRDALGGVTMRVLLTGATGFVGRVLLPRLAAAGHEVVAVTRDGAAAGQPCWDLARGGPASATLPARIDAVVHAAQSRNYRGFPGDGPELFAVNAASTAALLDYAAHAGASRFCLLSTGTVYEPFQQGLDETAALAPTSMLGASKLAAEVVARPYGALFRLAVLRLFTLYGPGQAGRLMPDLIRRVRDGVPVRLSPDGEGMRLAPLHIDDLCAIVAAALDGGWNGTFNVAAPGATTLRGVAGLIGGVLGRSPVFEIGPEPALDLAPPVTRLAALYDLGGLVDLGKGLRRTVDV